MGTYEKAMSLLDRYKSEIKTAGKYLALTALGPAGVALVVSDLMEETLELDKNDGATVAELKAILREFRRLEDEYDSAVWANIKSQMVTSKDAGTVKALRETAQKYVKRYGAAPSEVQARKGLQEWHEGLSDGLKKDGWIMNAVELTTETRASTLEARRDSPEETERWNEKTEKWESSGLADPEITKEAKEAGNAYQKEDSQLYAGADGMSANDVQQGAVGDCFLLASIAALAKTMPSKLKKQIKDNEDGTFSVTLFLRKDPRSEERTKHIVLVDADFLFDDEGNPLYAGKGDGEIWVMVLEKAYAKVKGGYDNLDDGGWTEEALETLTGTNAEVQYLSDMTDKELLTLCQQAVKDKNPVTLSSDGSDDSNRTNLDGGRYVVHGHAYALETVKGSKILVRNPWGYNPETDEKDESVFGFSAKEVMKHFSTVTVLG